MRQKLIDADDGTSALSTCAHAAVRRRGSSHTLFGIEPLHTPVSTEASCVAPPLFFWLCGQNTQFRLHSASVGGSDLSSTDTLARREGIKTPRRRHCLPEHKFPSPLCAVRARASTSHVWFAPQRLRCRCATTKRSVLIRCGTPKLSCFGAVVLTGRVFSKRVSTCVRFARAHEVHWVRRLCPFSVSMLPPGCCAAGKSCRCTLLSAGCDLFCASIEQVSVVFLCVHVWAEYSAPGIGSAISVLFTRSRRPM
jgi:hypothetical protein